MSRNRTLTPAIPFFFAYDTTSQTISTGGTWLKWNTISIATRHFTYESGSGRIYLKRNSYGLFRIKVDLSAYEVSAADHTRIQLYKNGQAVDGAKAECKSNDSNDATGVSLEYIIKLDGGDYIQIKATASGGNTKTLAHSSRIIIEYIPTYGYNNGSGGRMHYRGGVIR